MKKKIALLGDSIRMIGYGQKVPQILGDDFEVFQPEENCRFVKHTLRGLIDWKKGLKNCDLIHWNNGLWDATMVMEDGKPFSSVDEYVENMCRVADHLLKIAPKVIFATTTPVRMEAKYDRNEWIDKFNTALVPRLQEKGVIINDLNALLRDDVYAYICDDCIHLSEKGADVAAKQVAEMIINNI